MDKPKRSPTAVTPPEGTGGWLRRDCPLLWAHIADGSWSDGSRRTTSTLLFTVESGRLKACLNDREGRCSLWRVGATPEEAARAIEEALEGACADWKPWRSN